MNDRDVTREFLASQSYMALAVTLENGTPWALPVRIRRWEGREFEWDSKLSAVHSVALSERAEMAMTIFRVEDQFGFYASGRGELVETKGEFGHYRFVAERTWINDASFVKREVAL